MPQSISGEEYLPLLRRDPYALAAGGFKIFSSWSDNNSEIDPATVDWSSVNPKAFPYRVRQEPGPSNALGYIFFGFPNKYGIYMHDTANRWLFTEGSRNFSHGCIRLQNPLDFAEKVFNGRPGFDKAKVKQVIDQGQQAHYGFPEPVTLYVTYRTVGVGERRRGGVPRRRLRPRQARRRRDGQAAELAPDRFSAVFTVFGNATDYPGSGASPPPVRTEHDRLAINAEIRAAYFPHFRLID